MQSLPKVKADKPLEIGPSPYLHSHQSTSKILWGILVASSPLVIGSVIFFGWNALRIYSVAVSSGLLFEYLFQLMTGQKSRIHDGSTALTTILFSFLMPANVPFNVLVVGVFITIILAKELFGGLGQNLFHPVLVGYASIILLFPGFFGPYFQPLGTSNVFLILMCGFILIFKKLVRWENIIFYLLFSFLGARSWEVTNFLILIACFFITDSASAPITKEGRMLFSTMAGLLTASFCSWMNVGPAVASAVLISNSAVPLIDHFIRATNHK